jgi:hypothetical protein
MKDIATRRRHRHVISAGSLPTLASSEVSFTASIGRIDGITFLTARSPHVA